MRHFVLFLVVIYLGVFLFVVNRDDGTKGAETLPTVRIFGYSAFTGKWGPGPELKALFEKSCQCRVEFIDGSDSGVLMQRLKIEGESLGADLVVGFDQFDLQRAMSGITWQKLSFSGLDLVPEIKGLIQNDYFVPYDWGVLSFMTRKGELANPPQSLDDLLAPNLAHKIALEDPRTSSPGLQFLWWVTRSKGEDAGFKYLTKLMGQAHSFSPSWATALGLYNRRQVPLVFSYATSPLYYQLEEKNNDQVALEFREPHPMQIEFMGIPDFCRHCDLAEKFVNLMLSPEGQKVVMKKNYMWPVVNGVREGTPFAPTEKFKKTLRFEIPSDAELERVLKRWSELRHSGEAS